MRRDLDLCRTILFQVEEREGLDTWVTVEVPGRSQHEIIQHVRLLNDDGLIEAIDLSTKDGDEWAPKRLTAKGHDFIEAARSDTAWKAAMIKVKTIGGSITLEIVKELLVGYAKMKVGFPS